jgi:hypothetical protein
MIDKTPVPAVRWIVLGAALGLTLLLPLGCSKQAAKPRAGSAEESSRRSAGTLEATRYPGALIGMQYEPWFTPQNATWDTAEAIPLLGKYSSYNAQVLKQHAEWFEYLGINWILIDWSNMLWANPPWEKHQGGTLQLEQTTGLLFKTYSQLQTEGENPPKIVFLLGLENGPPVKNGVERLGEIFNWIDAHFLSNPQYKNVWLYYQGKPLITILYNPANPCKELQDVLKAHPLREPRWTIRWMASQLQLNHAEECGMWSWMDGTIRQLVTYHDGKPEETVVTPSCFAPAGWLATTAVGRDHGTPYIESWKVAFKARPKFIQVHQWNEFAGQKNGQGYGPGHRVYVDEYNLPFSDDLEPTQLNGCAYRGCGGWGYYYLNLTKALISLYRGETPDITVMALSGPFSVETVSTPALPLKWTTIGPTPVSYSLKLDGKAIANNIRGVDYDLNLARVRAGVHHVTLIAHGVHMYFSLDSNALAQKSSKPLPVTSTVEFRYYPRR